MKDSELQKGATKKETGGKNGESEFFIVGIGASAGGVQALKTFFENVPPDSGAAYVVILHLSPDHESHLAQILQTVSAIPVEQVLEKVRVEANHVYVVSPNLSLSMLDGHIIVSPIQTVEERRAPIDIFFRTLADSHSSQTIAVILSGTGADGSMGIKRIKELGGVTFVQNSREAEFGEMPRNSIATELVDEILNAAEIPAKIIAYTESRRKFKIPIEPPDEHEEQRQILREIFTQLRVRTGHDFSNYKRPTVLRRIERRINVRTLPSMSAYARYLKENSGETQSLLKDLLISVTNFFRDKEAFGYLEQEIVPKILDGKKAGDQVRVWAAGCATGEEAYSLAMLFAERLDGVSNSPEVQIFATDIDEGAIKKARKGLYTINDAADVSPERLRRFFIEETGGYRVRRELSQMVLFASHNLLKDPPFSRLDLITCRNLLIYLNHLAQKSVLNTFHFALDPDGYLFTGTSESIDGAGDLFAPVSAKNHIYQSRPIKSRLLPAASGVLPALNADQPFPSLNAIRKMESHPFERLSFGDLHQQLLEQYAPPSIVINEQFDIVHVSPHAGRYLRISGEVSNNLFKLIRPELRLHLSSAVNQAVAQQTNVVAENLRLKIDDRLESISVQVRPALRFENNAARGFLLIVFQKSESAPDDGETFNSVSDPTIVQLEEALLHSQTEHRYSVKHSEIQAEELKASNEELQAINEELRSATEELETGKEELLTVNQELKIKIEEFSNSNSDLRNLMNSTNIGTIFLDPSHRVKMFTPAACELFNLIQADMGRALSDITHKLEYQNLIADVETVLQKLQTVEREVRASDGSVYLMQITPYRTAEDRISGTIVMFVNITTRKRAEDAHRESVRKLERQTRIFDTTLSTITDFAYIFDRDGRFVYSNQPLLDLLGITAEEIAGKNFFDLGYPADLAARLQSQIQHVFDTKETVRDETPFVSPAGEDGFYEYIFNPVIAADGSVESVAGSTRDITAHKRSEAALRDSEAQIAADLAGMQRLYELQSNLADQTDIKAALRNVLAAACEFTGTDRGCVQLLSADGERLEMAVWQGYADDSPFINFFRCEGFEAGCEVTRVERRRLIIEDTIDFEGLGETAAGDAVRADEIRAAQSTPMTSRAGETIGVISTQFRQPHRPTEHELRLLDMLSWTAGEFLERHRADAELRKAHERLQTAMNTGRIFSWEMNPATRELEFSDNVESVIGFPIPEHINRVFELIHPDDRAPMIDLINGAMETGGSFTAEYRLLNPANGEAVWFASQGGFTNEADRAESRFVGIAQNITERRRAEEKLRDSEERLRLIIKSVADYAIITTDTERIVNGWNPGAEKMFGYAESEVVGKPADIIFTPEDLHKGEPEKEMQTAIERGSAEDERFHLRRDGSRFYVSGVMQPIKDGKIDGFVKIARDMTERIKAEQNERDKEMLQKLVGAQEDERKRIARDLHDELGQLLTGLRLKLEAVRKLCENNAELCGKVDETQTLAKRIDEGVDFLAWELRPAALDDLGLRAALEKYVREWSHYAGVTAELLSSAAVKKIRLAPEAETNLYRIAQEALNNVHKHAEAKNVEVSLEKRGANLIVLIISDNGKGFEPETKMDRSTGIGLIGMRERAALIGGTFEIESAPGKGTTIYVRIPISFPGRQ